MKENQNKKIKLRSIDWICILAYLQWTFKCCLQSFHLIFTSPSPKQLPAHRFYGSHNGVSVRFFSTLSSIFHLPLLLLFFYLRLEHELQYYILQWHLFRVKTNLRLFFFIHFRLESGSNYFLPWFHFYVILEHLFSFFMRFLFKVL